MPERPLCWACGHPVNGPNIVKTVTISDGVQTADDRTCFICTRPFALAGVRVPKSLKKSKRDAKLPG